MQVQRSMASNFATLQSTDPKFLALKDLYFFQTVLKFQGASKILRMVFGLSKGPHLLHKMGFVDSLTHTTVLKNLLFKMPDLKFKTKVEFTR